MEQSPFFIFGILKIADLECLLATVFSCFHVFVISDHGKHCHIFLSFCQPSHGFRKSGKIANFFQDSTDRG